MRALFKLMAIMAAFFACLLGLGYISGLLQPEAIGATLLASQDSAPLAIGFMIAGLLFIDIFISVPTLSTVLIAGFLLGPVIGAAFSIAGLVMAGLAGYGLSHLYGARLFHYVMRQPEEQAKARLAFAKYGFWMILAARSVPMLPEICACLAGLTGMRFWRFLAAWLLGAVPYALIAAYAGSASSFDNPAPALLMIAGFYLFTWGGVFLFNRVMKRQPA